MHSSNAVVGASSSTTVAFNSHERKHEMVCAWVIDVLLGGEDQQVAHIPVQFKLPLSKGKSKPIYETAIVKIGDLDPIGTRGVQSSDQHLPSECFLGDLSDHIERAFARHLGPQVDRVIEGGKNIAQTLLDMPDRKISQTIPPGINIQPVVNKMADPKNIDTLGSKRLLLQQCVDSNTRNYESGILSKLNEFVAVAEEISNLGKPELRSVTKHVRQLDKIARQDGVTMWDKDAKFTGGLDAGSLQWFVNDVSKRVRKTERKNPHFRLQELQKIEKSITQIRDRALQVYESSLPPDRFQRIKHAVNVNNLENKQQHKEYSELNL